MKIGYPVRDAAAHISEILRIVPKQVIGRYGYVFFEGVGEIFDETRKLMNGKIEKKNQVTYFREIFAE